MTSNDVDPCLSKSGIGGPRQNSLNTVDDVTLAYMVNASQYEKYLKKNHLDYDSVFNKDIRFYRKRIISLTKELFKNQNEPDKKQNVLVGAFNMYMRTCISYLKFSDQSETIQKCYVCLGITNENENKKCVCKNKNEDELFYELNKANELCFKPKEVKKITLDNYVIRKNVKKGEPVVYPQRFVFNPRDPAFKHKGLKSKPPSRSQSAEKIRIESDIIHNTDELTDDKLKKVTNIEDGENGEKNEKLNEKLKNNKKKKKKKKVSFDVTNYIDNI